MGYECLLAGLPELMPGIEAPLTMEALEEQLATTLKPKDREQLHLLKCHAQMGACAFIQDWLRFNTDLNNVLTAEICKKYNLALKGRIVGQLPDDVEPEVKEVSRMQNLYERERQLDTVRFAWLEERTRMVDFSLENVLAYYLKLQILCRWQELTREKGEQVFRDIVADFKKGIKIE